MLWLRDVYALGAALLSTSQIAPNPHESLFRTYSYVQNIRVSVSLSFEVSQGEAVSRYSDLGPPKEWSVHMSKMNPTFEETCAMTEFGMAGGVTYFIHCVDFKMLSSSTSNYSCKKAVDWDLTSSIKISYPCLDQGVTGVQLCPLDSQYTFHGPALHFCSGLTASESKVP